MTSRALPALLGAAAALALARPAAAAPCSMLTDPIYIAGSGKVVVGDLAKPLSASGVHIVYKTIGSCIAVDAILNGTPIGTATDLTASYWDPMSGEQKCNLPAAGQVIDVGLSDVFASTCQSLPNGLPSNVGDFYGPVDAYTFVVPKTSTQKSISKAAAYFVFGFGSGSGVAPWTDETELFIRDPNSGTQQMLGAAIGVPPTKWKGQDAKSSAGVVTMVSGAADPMKAEKAIGILAASVADANRPSVDVIAYKDTDQTCAYWPDSTQTGSDKRNVRDGHYAIWGPLHLFTKLNGMGYPINAAAADVIAYLTGTKKPPNGVDLISLLVQAGFVPACAMQVRRTSELGPLTSFAPDVGCGCYFDVVATGASKCTACTSDVQCSDTAPKCNYGYCEAQ